MSNTRVDPNDPPRESPVRLEEVQLEVRFDTDGFQKEVEKLAEEGEWTRRGRIAELAQKYVEFHVLPVPGSLEDMKGQIRKRLGENLKLEAGGKGVVADTPEEARERAEAQAKEHHAAKGDGKAELGGLSSRPDQ